MNKFPDYVIKTLSLLNDNGFEAVVVGGAVRDLILGKTPHDYDIASNATVDDICRIFKDYKIIETGLKHGTVTIHINHNPVEITIYRGTSNTLKEDLYLRDFTINSMAMDISYKLYDYYNGVEDIKNKIIRCNNDTSLSDDPLRILRAIRQAGKYKFTIDERTHKLMNKYKDMLNNVSKERIASELNYIMVCDDIYELIDNNRDIFFTLIPEFKSTYNFKQNNPYHIYDVYEHTLHVIKNTPNILEVRLAALFHDLGKVKNHTTDEKGIDHFYNHPLASTSITKSTLKKYRYDNKTIDIVSKLVEYHDYPLEESTKSLKKFLNKFGSEHIDLWFMLKRADVIAQNPRYISRLETIDRIHEKVKELVNNNECVSLKQLEISGRDLIILGFTSGKQIGDILDDCLVKVIDNKLENNKDRLIEYIQNKYIKEI